MNASAVFISALTFRQAYKTFLAYKTNNGLKCEVNTIFPVVLYHKCQGYCANLMELTIP